MLIANRLNLAPYIGETLPIPRIGQVARGIAQNLRKDTREVASASPRSGSPAERAAGRQAIVSMWNSSIVAPEVQISQSLSALGAQPAAAKAAHSKTREIQTTLLSIGAIFSDAGNERTGRLLEVDFSRLEAQRLCFNPTSEQTSRWMKFPLIWRV